jgi:hypothetical protein
MFALSRHERACNGNDNPIRRVKSPIFVSLPNGNVQCPECSKEFSPKGSATHWRIVHVGDRRFGSGGPGWSKGLTKETSEVLRKQALKISETYKAKIAKMTPEERNNRYGGAKRFSALNGGLRRGSGRGKSGWYRGIWCDSSWELAWVLHSIDHGIAFERNTESFLYDFEGKQYKFYPDFKMSDGSLLEIKGWLDAKNRAKLKRVPELTVIGKTEIKPFLQYAIEKHGTKFWHLYGGEIEVRKPRKLCSECQKPITYRATKCKRCQKPPTKIDWPNIDKLLLMVAGRKMSDAARKLGVSTSAIKKRLERASG